jgi:hypothetical protein
VSKLCTRQINDSVADPFQFSHVNLTINIPACMGSWSHQNKPTGTNRHQWITPTSTQLFDVTENRVQKTLFNRQSIDLGGWVGEANQRSHGHQHKSSGSTENFGHQGATWRAQVAIWPCNDVCGEESEHHQLLHVSSFQSMVGVSKILDPGPKHSHSNINIWYSIIPHLWRRYSGFNQWQMFNWPGL